MISSQDAARSQMVKQQVRAWDVLDPAVLQVLADVPREHFVPERYRRMAFADTNIPLANKQCMMTPQVEGRVLQALAIRTGDRALEIGTGSGFLAACLAHLAGAVESLEIFADLAAGARKALAAAGCGNVQVTNADAFAYQPADRWDVIAVTGSTPTYDVRFEQWLAIGGRLFVIVGDRPLMQALLVRRTGEESWDRGEIFETVMPPLLNATLPDRFDF